MINDVKERVLGIFELLKSRSDDPSVLRSADYLSFVISMLPIPGISQVATIANRIVKDHALNIELNKIKSAFETTNSQLLTAQTELEKINSIGVTLRDTTALQKSVEHFLKQVIQSFEASRSEFVMETTNWSTQHVINQVIKVDWATITAENYSHNVLRNTNISSPRTHLKANNHSSNIIDGTNFLGNDGSVGMRGIHQSGSVQVSGSSVGFGEGGTIGFGPGGAIMFGAPPSQLNAVCPQCKYQINVSRDEVRGLTRYTCPKCKTVLPISNPI